MDPIKDAFEKIKQDMSSLENDLDSMKNDLSETRRQMSEICEIIENLFVKIEDLRKNPPMPASTHNPKIPTVSTHPSTLPQEIEGLKPQNLGISTGNEGVSTDRQTHQQTDISTQIMPKIQEKPDDNTVDNVGEILDSLDAIKKEIRLKFKRLTDQEWLIFSTIYQLDEQGQEIDYKVLAGKLKLTESSIRDYVGRLIKKGVPVDKTKVNNKQIQLSVSKNLKKIASLSTIMQLREL